jgi:hypothetical protein
MSETKKTWDGLRVHAPLWYPKHPQLSIKGIKDNQIVADARPRPDDVFVGGSGGYLVEPYLEETQGYLGADGYDVPAPTWDDMI